MKKTKVRSLNKFLREARMDAGLTQLQASRHLDNSTSQYVSNFERGLCAPSLKTTLKLIDLYGMSKREVYRFMVDEYRSDLKKEMFR